MKQIESQNILIVDEGKTGIINSPLCNEAFCLAVRKEGNNQYLVIETSNVNIIKDKCREVGFPNDFIIENIESNLAYIMPANSEDGEAICVEEVYNENEVQIEYSRVKVRGWENRNNKDIETLEQEI